MFSTDTMMALSAMSIIRLMSRERCQDIAMLAVKNRNETECGFWSLCLKLSLFAGLFFDGGTPVQNWDGIIHFFSIVITLAVLVILNDELLFATFMY